jgi:pilus assembly protein CpaE
MAGPLASDQGGQTAAKRRRVVFVPAPGRASEETIVRQGMAFELVVETPGYAWNSLRAWSGAGVDLLIVEIDERDDFSRRRFAAGVAALRGTIHVAAAVRTMDPALMRTLYHAGAVDVLPLPLDDGHIEEALEAAPRPTANAETRRQGKVIGFLGAQGGSGATAIATQAAVIWADKRRTCLIDMDPQRGAAALYLNIDTSLTFANLVEAGQRLDDELMSQLAVRHPSGLSVIAAPRDVSPLDLANPRAIETIVQIATNLFDVTVLDLPGAILDWSLRAMELCDRLVMITPVTIGGLHQAQRRLAFIEANGLSDRVVMVANRVKAPMFGAPETGDSEKLLQRKWNYLLTDEPALGEALDLGKTLSQVRRGTRLEKDLRAMVTKLDQDLDLGDPAS